MTQREAIEKIVIGIMRDRHDAECMTLPQWTQWLEQMLHASAIDVLVEGAHRWRASLEEDGWTDAEIRNIARPGVAKIYEAICELERRQ